MVPTDLKGVFLSLLPEQRARAVSHDKGIIEMTWSMISKLKLGTLIGLWSQSLMFIRMMSVTSTFD